MHLTDGRRRKAALAEVPVETIDVERLQQRQPNRAQNRDDLSVDVLLVVIQRRVGPAQARDVFHPSIEQRRQRWVVERHVAGATAASRVAKAAFASLFDVGATVRITR